MKKVRPFISAVLIIMLALSTVSASYAGAKASPRLNKSSITLKIGKKFTLKLLNNKQKVKWKSSAKKIAAVNSKGTVTAKKAGTATISAAAGGKTYKCKVKVQKKLVTKIKLSKSKLTLTRGKVYKLKATVSPKTATDKKLNWKSSNSTVASVEQNGRITANRPGSATVKAAAKDGSKKSATCKVTVKPLTPEAAFSKALDYIDTYYTDKDETGNNFIHIDLTEDYPYQINYTFGMGYLQNENALKFTASADFSIVRYNVRAFSQMVMDQSDLSAASVIQTCVFTPVDENAAGFTIVTKKDLDVSAYSRSTPVSDLDIQISPENIALDNTDQINELANALLKVNLHGAQVLLTQSGTSLEELGFISY